MMYTGIYHRVAFAAHPQPHVDWSDREHSAQRAAYGGRKAAPQAAWSKTGLLCALGYVSVFLVLASVLRNHFGFPLDDSWIHEVVARNFAEYKVLGFVPGHLTSGSTSLLWSLILAFRALVVPALSPVIYCAGISVALLAGIGYVMKAITDEDGLPGGASWCIALAPAASGNFLWFGLLGMEHLLFILLSLCVMRAWWAPPANRQGAHRIVLPLLCFLLVITRPEGICLLGLLFLFRRAAARTLGEWVVATIGAGCGGLVSAGVNWMTGHHLTPLTMQGRNGVLPTSSWLKLRLEFLGHTFARLLSVWSINAPQHVLHGRRALIGVLLAAALGLMVILAIRYLRLVHAGRVLLLCSWGGVIQLLYFFMLPSPGHGGRYIAVPVMIFLPLVFLGLHQALTRWLHTRRAWVIVGVVGMITAVASLSEWRAAATADIEQINTEHGEMAEWIVQNIPAGTIAHQQIAVFDIGRIGYQLHGNLVDLGGLVDYKFKSYLVSKRTAEYLQQRDVRYVVLAGGADPTNFGFSSSLSLDRAHGVDLTLMHASCADPQVAKLAFTASETALLCERLYAIHYGVPAS